MSHYAIVALFILIAFGMVIVSLLAGSLLRPNRPSAAKLSTYECGEKPIGTAWANFNIRFYAIALLFLLFEVEAVFIFPVAAVYQDWLAGPGATLALVELLLFVFILFFALIYAWGRGDLEWVREFRQRLVADSPTPGKPPGADRALPSTPAAPRPETGEKV